METTQENNRLFVEFVGHRIVGGYLQKYIGSSVEPKKYWGGKPKTLEYQIFGWQITHHESKILYHSDWTWLMEVVEKIESLEKGRYSLIFQQKSCLLWDNDNGEELEDFNGSFKALTKFEAVYNACVAFIKWYNLNK